MRKLRCLIGIAPIMMEILTKCWALAKNLIRNNMENNDVVFDMEPEGHCPSPGELSETSTERPEGE